MSDCDTLVILQKLRCGYLDRRAIAIAAGDQTARDELEDQLGCIGFAIAEIEKVIEPCEIPEDPCAEGKQ